MARVTLKDVAREAEVSIVTASLVLNGASSKSQARVSEKRRALILETANRLGYRASAAGRLLKAQKIDDIGLLFFEDTEKIREHVGFADLNIQFSHICRQLGIRCQIDWFDSRRYPDTVPDLLTNGLVGGLLIAGNPFGASAEYLLRMKNLPFVRVEEPGEFSVMFDPVPALQEALRHLAETGHRRIGLVNGPESLQRYAKIKLVVSEYSAGLKLDFPPELYYEADPYRDFFTDALQAGIRITDSGVKPDALLVSSAVLAKAVISIFQQRGIRVPQDISVIALEATDWAAEKFAPPITAVECDYTQIVEDGIRLLRSLMDKETPAEPNPTVNEVFKLRRTVAERNCGTEGV